MKVKKVLTLTAEILALVALLLCLTLLVRAVKKTVSGDDYAAVQAGLASAQTEDGQPPKESETLSQADGDGQSGGWNWNALLPGLRTPEPSPTPEPTPTPVPTPTPLPTFSPVRTPSEIITGTEIEVNGESVESYQADAAHTMEFLAPEDYSALGGIVTFRGNNFRNTASIGTAQLNAAMFSEDHWTVTTGSLGGWGGSGWTGQPLAVQWPAATKQIMNMYDWAKQKDDLVEVIYATLAGKVYFLDLETGEKTRDDLYLGYTFKGAGSLDPRGYPLMYLGGGVSGPNGTPPIMVVSLIDGEVLYTTGVRDSLAPRGWTAWDSSPLVDAETDQLIYPGENGVLYIIDLNTQYDEAAGTISVDPEVVKFTFYSTTAKKFYYGMEDSAIAWRGHLFVADNGGDFVCIDLNKLEIEWRFDCLDDTNCTGVLELDDTGHPYIYLSTSYHLGWRGRGAVEIPVWKIDAVTGQEVWHHSYDCYSVEDLSGGVQGSLALGTGPLEGILYVPVARCPNGGNGKLVALDTATGEELWTYTSDTYSWVSPVCVYDTDGNGYVLYTSSIQGVMHLFNGVTGELCDTYSFGCTVEASPIVWNNTVVIGTRGQQIIGLTLE